MFPLPRSYAPSHWPNFMFSFFSFETEQEPRNKNKNQNRQNPVRQKRKKAKVAKWIKRFPIILLSTSCTGQLLLDMGPACSVVHTASDTPSEKTDFPFVSRNQLQMTSRLEVGPGVLSLLSVLKSCLAWTCAYVYFHGLCEFIRALVLLYVGCMLYVGYM